MAQTVIEDGDTFTVQGTYPPGFEVSPEKEVQVTATMPDVVAPSTPILIAPADDALTTDNTPLFIWKGSTDNVGVTSYSLYLDGTALLTNLPLSNAATANYTLTYDSSTQQYSVTPSTAINDGTHTWKIVAYDAAANAADSVTWSFTIDSHAPNFIVTQIGSVTTSISAQDTTTIPTSAIELSDNVPMLSGTGESGSSVVLYVRLPDSNDRIQELRFAIGSDSTWSTQLQTLERDRIYLLTFQITDAAGLLSILENVPFKIKGLVIEIPIPEGILPIESPIIIPIEAPPLELLSRSLHVIEVRIQETINAAIPSFVPQPVRTILTASAQSSRRLLSPVWYTHLLILFFLLLLPLIKFVLLAVPFGRNLSPNTAWTIWSAIFGYRQSQRSSLAVRAADQHTIPYMTARLVPVPQEGEQRVASHSQLFMSDQTGYFPPFTQLAGLYVVHVSLDERLLEFAKTRPIHLHWEDWYQGQNITLQKETIYQPLVMPIAPDSLRTIRSSWKKWLLQQQLASTTILVLSTALLVITPTIGNFITLGIFGSNWLIKSWKKRSTNVGITVTSNAKMPVPYALLRIKSTDLLQKYNALFPTNEDAKADIYLKNGTYDCRAIHADHRQKTPITVEINDMTETNAQLQMSNVLA